MGYERSSLLGKNMTKPSLFGVTIITLMMVTESGRAQTGQGKLPDGSAVNENLFLCSTEESLKLAKKVALGPGAKMVDWEPADPKIRLQFSRKVEGTKRYWVDRKLVETPTHSAVRRLLALAKASGGAVEGKFEDFSEEAQSAIATCFQAGPIGEPGGDFVTESLNRPQSRIAISTQVAVQGELPDGNKVVLDSYQAKAKQLPSLGSPLKKSSFQIVGKSLLIASDLNLSDEELGIGSRSLFAYLTELKDKQKREIENQIAEFALSQYQQLRQSKDGWDGKKPTKYSQLDEAQQERMRNSRQPGTSIDPNMKILPAKTYLMMHVFHAPDAQGNSGFGFRVTIAIE